MKKVLTIVAVVAFAASFTACKKDRTCVCPDDPSDQEFQTGKMSASDAETYCDSWDNWYDNPGADSDCSLK